MRFKNKILDSSLAIADSSLDLMDCLYIQVVSKLKIDNFICSLC